MDGQNEPRKALNRFNTGHYADLAALHADVVDALNNDLMAAHAALSGVTAQRDDLDQQVASLKAQAADRETLLTSLRKPQPEPKPPKGGRK